MSTSLLACLRLFVVAECVLCCGWFLRCSWLFYDMFGELFQLMFSCFNFLNVVSGCSTCLLFEISLWFVPHCFMLVFGEFRVVLGGVRWFFFDEREEMSALSARVWRVSATTPQQHQHPDNRAKRF